MNTALTPNIQGLETDPVKEVQLQPFDKDAAERLMREALWALEACYPTGALEWLSEMRPEVMVFLGECERQVDAAVLAKNMGQIRQTLSRFVEAHHRAFRIYQNQEAQGELFDD